MVSMTSDILNSIGSIASGFSSTGIDYNVEFKYSIVRENLSRCFVSDSNFRR